MNNEKVNILDVVRGTTVDGPGFRTSIYFAGCRHGCEGCHNPQSWDFRAGQPMSIDELMEIIREEDFDVTFSGGDPMYHVDFAIDLAKEILEENHNIWLYTGFTWEEIIASEELSAILPYVSVIVDSPFILSLRDTDLLFRGSSNQRLIDVQKSLAAGSIILYTK